MDAIKHIALFCGMILLCFGVKTEAAWAGSSEAVLLEIPEGDTAFLIDQKINKAWWITGECKRSIPLEPSKNAQSTQVLSKKLSENVTLGSRQIQLQQQFRFNLAPSEASVDVYSSVRGGWSSVPVEVNLTCDQNPTCRARMELPEC